MRAALDCVDEVDEAEEALDVCVVVLYRDLELRFVLLAADYDGLLEEHLLALVEVLDERADAAGVVVGLFLGLLGALVLEVYRYMRVEEGELAQPLLQDVGLEFRRRENFAVGHELHARAAQRGLADDLELRDGVAALVALAVLPAVAPYRELEPYGERVDDRDADAVKPARYRVGALVEFAARVQHREDDLGGRTARLVHARRDAAAVVDDADAAVLVYRDADGVAEAGEGFVYRVVDDLVDQVVQPALPLVADVHAGAFADRFEPFEYVYVLFVVVGGEIAVLRVYRKFHVCHL